MKRPVVILLIGIVLLVVASLVLAQAGELGLARFRIAGGGGEWDNERFTLSGTIGQVEAGVLMEGSSFALSGGYWGGAGGSPSRNAVHLPLLLKSQ